MIGGNIMDETANLKLLGLFLQCSYKLKTREKKRGQGRLLVLLQDNGPLTQKDLIVRTGRKSSTLSEQLESMEKEGFVTRKKDPRDKRNVCIELTQLGQEAALCTKAGRSNYADELFEMLTDNQKQLLIIELEQLVKAWGVPLDESEYGGDQTK